MIISLQKGVFTMKNIGMIKKLSIIFLILTFCSLHLGLLAMNLLGDVNTFSSAGLLKYTWVMWLFIPIPIITFVLALFLKKNNQKYVLKIVVSIIVAFLLLVFGSYRFLFDSVLSYDPRLVDVIEEKTGLDLPESIEVGAMDNGDVLDIRVKITDDKERQEFERRISNEQIWSSGLNGGVGYLLPPYYQMLSKNGSYEYVLFYNVTENKFNEYPTNENCEYIFVLYDTNDSVMVIIHHTEGDVLY